MASMTSRDARAWPKPRSEGPAEVTARSPISSPTSARNIAPKGSSQKLSHTSTMSACNGQHTSTGIL